MKKAVGFFDDIERQELIQKLRDAGHGELIDALLENERDVYTKKGRLNKSGACRVLDWKTKDLEEALKDCRQILKDEVES
jgi:nucleoside-diphosphate-sugar epimerase